MAFAPDQLVERVTAVLGDRTRAVRHQFGQVVAEIELDRWVEAVRALKDDPSLELDYFCFLSAIDWTESVTPAMVRSAMGGGPTPGGSFETREGAEGYLAPEGEVLQILVRLACAHQGHGVTLKTDLDRDDPRVATLTRVYGGADWHEREAHEMFGIVFEGHPNLVKLYLPDHFEGFPLRKHFVLGSRLVKPWPGIVDVEEMPATDEEPEAEAPTTEAAPARAPEPAPEPEPKPEPEPTPEPAPEPTPEPAPPQGEARTSEEATPPPPETVAAEPDDPEDALRAESFRTGIPTEILRRQRKLTTPRSEPGNAPPPPLSEEPEESLEAESERTGIPISILRRTREARKRASS